MPKLSEGTLNAVESDQIEFANDNFIRGQPDLIHQIKRKDTKRLLSTKTGGDRVINSSQLSELLQELSDQEWFIHRIVQSLCQILYFRRHRVDVKVVLL